MKYLVGILLIFVLDIPLMGCTSKPIPLAYDCPIITLPVTPISQTKKLTAHSTPDSVIKAYVADLSTYKRWNKAVYQEIKDVDQDEH